MIIYWRESTLFQIKRSKLAAILLNF